MSATCARSMFDHPAVMVPSFHRTETATASISPMFFQPAFEDLGGGRAVKALDLAHD